MLKVKMNVFSRCLISALVLVLALFVPCLTALAGSTVPTQHRRNPSFYVNGDVGIDIFNAPADSRIHGIIVGTLGSDVTHITRIINSSVAASLGFGYLFPINSWANLGARVFLKYGDNFGSYTGRLRILGTDKFDNTTQVKLRQFEYGIDFTPSAHVGANQLFTAIFGVAFNRARILNTSESVTGTPGLDPGTVESSMDRSLRGLRLGYSLEELLSQNFSVYMTYIWTGYGPVHSLQSVDINGAPTYVGNSGINFQTHNILLGLKYYFSPQNYEKHLIHNAFGGFYVGASFGNLIPQIQSSGQYRTTNPTTSNDKIAVHNGSQGAPTPLGVLGLGYGFLMHHVYLGAEALLNVASRISKSSLSSIGLGGDVDVEKTQNIRILLNTLEGAFDLKLGGIVAQQTLLIGRVGIAYNHIRMENFGVSNLRAVTNVAYVTQQVSKEVVGLRFGLGIEKLISPNFSLKMNYVYTYYGHVFGVASASPNPTTVPNINDLTASARVATHAVTVGMNYYFA